jgi:hypothetical protein
MEETTPKEAKEVSELEISYKEQMAKAGSPEYDPVMTVLIKKELGRIRRKAESKGTDLANSNLYRRIRIQK